MTADNAKYDVWLHWYVASKCNLKCAYCGTSLPQDGRCVLERLKLIIGSSGVSGLFAAFGYKAKRMILHKGTGKIDAQSLMKTLAKTGRVFKIGITGGGEPFLIPDFIETCKKITEKHFVGINTNLTSDEIERFCETIDPARVIYIVASAHLKELERLRLMDRFLSNFLMCKSKGFNIFAREVAYPPLLAEANEYMEFFKRNGIELFFDPFIGEYNSKRYPDSYTESEIKVFDFGKTFNSNPRLFYQKRKICNAGYNVGVVDSDGYVRPCDLTYKVMGNLYSGIKFSSGLMECPFEFCGCPLKEYDRGLFERAMAECGTVENPRSTMFTRKECVCAR